jgi:hypothetical protein
MYDEKKFHKYLREVEDKFIEKRGTPFILSSEDVQIILFWFKRDIPLKVIKKGIEDVFEKLQEKDKEKKVNSIKYCAQRIEELYKEEKMKASRSWHSEGMQIDIPSSLDKNIKILKEFFKDKDEFKGKEKNFIKKIENLKKLDNLDEIEDNLKKIEEKIIESYYNKIEKEEKEKLKKRVEENLSEEVKALPSIAKNSLIKMVIFENIKKEKNIPTISLLL